MTMSTTNPTAVSAGRARQRGRTRAALLSAAATLLAAGATPTVGEVADAAAVSRRTAYRYFATQEQLLVEAALEGLRPAIEGEIIGASRRLDEPVGTRLDRTVRALQRNTIDNEALLRTMIRLTVGPSDPAAGEQTDVPRRRGYRRLEWIELAVGSEKSRLGTRRYERLVAALSVCVGIDALVVLRDLCGLSANRAEGVTRWMAQTLLEASLAEAMDTHEQLTATRNGGVPR